MAERKDRAVVRVAGLRYWRAPEARVVVEAWQQSGETLAGFAGRYGIKAKRLSRWARQLETGGESVAFHPVRLLPGRRPEVPGGEPIEIVLDGCTVRVPHGFAADDLERVLSVLAAEASC